MNRAILCFLCLFLISVGGASHAVSDQPTAGKARGDADQPPQATLIVEGRVWTGNAERPWAEAVAVAGDRILAVGTRDEIKKLGGKQTELLDAGDGLVVPGLIDSHIHLIDGGERLACVQLRDANSRDEFARRIGEHARKQKPGEWITGGDWDHSLWGGELPTRDWIDAVTPDNPVWINRLDGHMALANSAAMRAAKVGDDVADVKGGEIVRDSAGRPTGIFKDNAMGQIERAVPNSTLQQQLDATVAAMDYLAERGVTAVHHMGSWRHVEVFRAAQRQGLLKTRIYACTPLEQWQRLANELRDRGGGDEWLKIGGLKGYVDGSLGSHTAAFLEPFSDAPKDRGLLVNTAEDLEEWTAQADRAGLQVVVHAIGDRAIRIQLDVFERVAETNGPRDRRFRTEHAQHIAPQDIPRFAKLGVIPSMQPYHAIDDGRWADRFIGAERSATTYAFRSLIDSGARPAFGSDWFVAPPTPMEGIYAAVTRRTLDDKNPNGWVPEQKINVEEALRAYTIDAAYAGFSESSLGSIEPGKLADMVILERDLFKTPPEELGDVPIKTTIVGGKVVYSRAEQQPAVKPVEPAEAIGTIVVPKGLRVQLVAAEPLVRDPVALEFDENGAAYVIELKPYNAHGKPGPRPPTSIARLEDTDGDGRFDKRTTFADDLKYASGIFCYDGGLFVGDPPDLLYLKDTDNDGRADQRDVLFTGFGAAPAGESQLNSFRWGLDNRIHISTGLDGGDIRPGNQPDAPAQTVRNRRLLLDPRKRSFELTSGGGQHGMSFDDWGRTYVCGNSTPIQAILYDDRYIERNPLMSAPPPVLNIGPGANFTKLARISPPEAWRRIRTRLQGEGATIDDTFEPGRVSGIFTSATGITIYRGDAWPEEYRGNAFVGEVVNNCVYRARLKSDGLGITSERAGGDAEFMASSDTWFRPAQFAHGPDGNLYVLDMYRELIEGVQWVPPQVLAEMDSTAGSDRGRIYRIVPNDFKQPPPVRMADMSIETLVGLLEHANSWHRETAARLLYQRQDKSAAAPLRRLLAESKSPQGRMHAFYALGGIDELDIDDISRGLADEHPRVREHAIRLAEQFAASNDTVRQKLVSMVDDPDVAVRFQLAFSLGCLPTTERYQAIVELLRRDGADSWFRVALQSSLGDGAAEVLRVILVDEKPASSIHAQEFLTSLASQIGRGNKQEEIATAVAAIDRLAGDSSDAAGLAKKLIVAMLGDGSGVTALELVKHSHGRVKAVVLHLLTDARTTALDQEKPPESRLEAISILGCGSFASEEAAFDELLAPQQPQPIQEAVLKILGRFSDIAVVELLLAKWPGLTPGLRASAAEVLLSRPAWAEGLLSAFEKEEVARGDFDPARVALLKSHPSTKIRERAAAVFSNSGVARRAEVVADYQGSLKLAGDVERGRDVFKKSCSACHELEGVGTKVGADLNSIRDKGAEAVLLNVLDPNREILPQYLTYVVLTLDGRAVTGMIAEESPNNLTIRQADSTTVAIPRADIDEMTSSGISYMPEGLETQIDPQAMADLLAYLMSVGSGEQGAGNAE